MSSDSESDSEVIRVSSQKTAPTEHDVAPDTIEYKMKVKLKGPAGKRSRLSFLLKKGVELPYTPIMENVPLEFTFTKSLDVLLAGHDGRKEDGFWIFELKGLLNYHFLKLFSNFFSNSRAPDISWPAGVGDRRKSRCC